jgi:anaerobic magnesium-protoporphyrin IX monomethyl ester cyclase
MKVLLVVPTHHYQSGSPLSLSDFPTGVAYLASALERGGHTVIGCNPNNLTGYPSNRVMLNDILSKKLTVEKPDLVGIGGLATDYAFLEDAIHIIRNVSTAKIVLGGQIVTNDPDVFDLLKPDYAITGEADISLVELCKALPTTGGIIKGKIPLQLDDLPFPNYEPFGVKDMLDNHSEDTRLLYRYSRPYPRPWVIVASRSCPFDCSFCVHGHRDIPYRARSIPNIMAEIKQTWEKYKYNILMIDDELFAVNNTRLREFSQAVLDYKAESGADFDWMFQTHASAKLDLETLKLARKAGCYLFSYGLESASPAVLKSMNKRIKVSQVEEAIELAHQSNIGFSANLIFGDVAETTDTWAESLAFWFTHRQDFIFLANLFPYPGSKLFDTLRAKGFAPDKRAYYESIDKGVINMTSIPQADFENLIKLTSSLERGWLFCAKGKNVRSEAEYVKDGMTMYKLKAECPYCGQESLYRQSMDSRLNGRFSLGTGCLTCNRKIKLDIT